MKTICKVNKSLRDHLIPIDDLKPDPENIRLHPEANLELIMKSLDLHGQQQTLQFWKKGKKPWTVKKGNGTLIAAQRLGWSHIAAIPSDAKNEDQADHFAIVDNRSSDLSTFDPGALLERVEGLKFGEASLGFTLDELKGMQPEEEPGEPEKEAIPTAPKKPQTKPGTLWELGRHRLLCADSIDLRSIKAVLQGETPDLVFADPPYGIDIVKGGGIGGDSPITIEKPKAEKGMILKGKSTSPWSDDIAPRGEYAPIIGDDSIQSAVRSFNIAQRFKGALLVFWGAQYYAEELPASGGWIVWDKETGESFLGDAELAWTNRDRAVKICRHKWCGMVRKSERGKRLHPTQKPVALVEFCMGLQKGEIILDPFGGCGPSLIAAERNGWKGRLIELSPAYCDVICQRFFEETGEIPVDGKRKFKVTS